MELTAEDALHLVRALQGACAAAMRVLWAPQTGADPGMDADAGAAEATPATVAPDEEWGGAGAAAVVAEGDGQQQQHTSPIAVLQLHLQLLGKVAHVPAVSAL